MKVIPSLWPELWLQIFSYLPNLDLLHATLTHRFFCELVQPLLFREAHLYLPTIANGGRPGVTAVDNSASQRLHTISSPRIAHAVRKLTLRSTSYTTALLSHEYQTLCHYQSTIQMIVELLPCFTALSTLACDKLRWSTCLFEDLAAIKQLRVLELKDCLLDIDRGGVLNRLNVNILTLESSDLERFPVKGWDSVINAHCTNYSVGGAQSFSLASLSARPEILPSLHSLNTNVYDEYLTLSMVLGKSSHTLRTLCVNFRADSELVPLLSSSPHWPILPLLSSYTGPVALLSLLTTTELLNNIRHLDLRDRQRDALHFHSIQSPEVLSRFNRSESLLETLILPTSAITQDHLETIFSCNPYLRHLTIWDYGWREWDSDPLSLEVRYTSNQLLIEFHVLTGNLHCAVNHEPLSGYHHYRTVPEALRVPG